MPGNVVWDVRSDSSRLVGGIKGILGKVCSTCGVHGVECTKHNGEDATDVYPRLVNSRRKSDRCFRDANNYRLASVFFLRLAIPLDYLPPLLNSIGEVV